MDSYASGALTIPSFTLNGVAYTTAYMTSNGLLTLGGSAPSSTAYTGISAGAGSGICICPMNADLDRVSAAATSEMRWQTIGDEIIFQWQRICRYGIVESFDFQVRLNTVNGEVIFVYQLNSGPASSTSYQPQVGIRTSSSDYSNRSISSGSENWSTSLAGSSNTNTCRFTSASPAKNFTTGLTYKWTPPTPCTTPTTQPTSLTFGTITSTSIAGSFTAASPVADRYLVVATTGAVPTTPVDGTTYTAGASALGGTIIAAAATTTFTASSLTANTAYSFYVYAYNSQCSGGPKYYTTSPLTASTSTCLAVPVMSISGITGTTLDFTWATITGATSYTLEVATDNAFASPVTGSPFTITAPTVTQSVTGLTAATLYYYRIKANGGSCNSSNSTTASVGTATAIPWSEGFASASTPTGWTNTSSWTVGTGPSGITGNPGNLIYYNLYSSATSASFNTLSLGPITATSSLSFDYRLANFSSPYAAPSGSWGNFKVQISANGGAYSDLATVNDAAVAGWVNKSYSLSTYAGQSISIKILATWSAGDFNIAFDNFLVGEPCITPTAQATSLSLTAGSTSISGSFTASSPASSGYLVVRTAGSAPTNPVDGTTYSVGASALGGTIVAAGSSTNFSATGLTQGNSYSFYVYSYSSGCVGAPKYLVTTPLTDNATTNATFTSIASGNWEDGSTWNQSGAVPTSANDVIIAGTHTVSVNATSATASSLTVNATGTLTVLGSILTIPGVASSGVINNGSINVNGGTLTVGITDNSFCNRTLANNATLTVSSGTLNVYGNITNGASSVFNQSGGNINIDGNAAGVSANSVASEIALLQFNQLNTGINLTGGTLTIIDPHANATQSNVIGYSNGTVGTQTSLSTHLTRFGNSISTDAGGNVSGFRVDNWTSSAFIALGSIEVNGPIGTNRGLTSAYQFVAHGNVTVNNGGLINIGTLVFSGNLTVNSGGIYYNTTATTASRLASNTGSALTFGPSINAQTITNSGTIQNSSTTPTANFVALSVNNTHVDGLTFGTGITSPTITGALTLTNGNLNASTITLQGTSAQTVTLTAATSLINVNNFTLNNSLGATLIGSGFLNVTGTVTPTSGTLAAGGRLVLKSTSTSTARIAAGTGTYMSGNIIQERYIPAKSTRRFSFIASPVSQALSAAWQQQIHITGAGTGGTACPTLTAHSNGFDATVTNAPSMFSYDAGQASGSRWTANTTGTTGFTLTPGTGYRLNVRGPRTTGCSLLDGTTTATTAVTLSATGAISNAAKNLGTFTNTYTNNATTGEWILIGNPYPSEIDFSAFRADAANSGVINASYIIYDPANAPDAVTPANMYSTWNAGTWSNAPTSISNANGQYIANGQAFFVQASAPSANITLTFKESFKYSGSQNGVFRQRSWNDIIRIGLNKDAVNIDNTVIRYANDNGISNNQLGELDATLMSTGNSYLGTLKAGKTTAIQTRQLQILNTDTVAVDFNVAASGTYSFNFSEHDNFSATNIYLLDRYTKTTQEVKSNPVYSFTVDKNNAATQTNRFALVFSKAIPVTAITGVKVYPNPADKQITVQLPQTSDKYTVSITDVAGKRVYQSQLASGTQNINVAKFTAGNYIIEITDAKGNRTTEKLVKQ